MKIRFCCLLFYIMTSHCFGQFSSLEISSAGGLNSAFISSNKEDINQKFKLSPNIGLYSKFRISDGFYIGSGLNYLLHKYEITGPSPTTFGTDFFGIESHLLNRINTHILGLGFLVGIEVREKDMAQLEFMYGKNINTEVAGEIIIDNEIIVNYDKQEFRDFLEDNYGVKFTYLYNPFRKENLSKVDLTLSFFLNLKKEKLELLSADTRRYAIMFGVSYSIYEAM